MWWIDLVASIFIAWYDPTFSPSSYPSESLTAVHPEFRLDDTQSVAECWKWALCMPVLSCHNKGLPVVYLEVLSMDFSRCSCYYTRLPSVARLAIYMFTETFKWCMPDYVIANHITVRETNMIHNILCAYGTLSSTALNIRPHVSCRAALIVSHWPVLTSCPLLNVTILIVISHSVLNPHT